MPLSCLSDIATRQAMIAEADREHVIERVSKFLEKEAEKCEAEASGLTKQDEGRKPYLLGQAVGLRIALGKLQSGDLV